MFLQYCIILWLRYSILCFKKHVLVWFAFFRARQMHLSPDTVMPQKMFLWVHRPFVFSFLHYCLVHCFSILRSTWGKTDFSFYTLIEWYSNIQLHLPSSALHYIVVLCCKTTQLCCNINTNYYHCCNFRKNLFLPLHYTTLQYTTLH